jgi:hypothetical protein
LPVPVDEFVSKDDIWPTKFEVAASRGAVCGTAKHMAVMHPDLWGSVDIARLEKKRVGGPEVTGEVWVIPYNVTSYKGMAHTSGRGKRPEKPENLLLFEYRMAGPGQKLLELLATDENTARTHLEKVGEIAVLRVVAPDWDEVPMLLIDSDDEWLAEPIGRVTVTERRQLPRVALEFLAAQPHPPLPFRQAGL